jgi:hypothetical protein
MTDTVIEIRKAMVALENAFLAAEAGKAPEQVLRHLQNSFKEGHDALALLPK